MKYSCVKGTQDIFPPDVALWQKAEAAAREAFAPFGFREIRPPVMEYTEVFTRSIGETSDIVEKEMYTFADRAGRSITLRPEGTAPVVRAYVQHHLNDLPAPQKFYYMGPMFRYERPQKGRQRQFHQIGAEAFGSADPTVDAEMIAMLNAFLRRMDLGGLKVELNSIGCAGCRPAYRVALTEYFRARVDNLCEDCRRRLEANPLRILDCKVEGCRTEKAGAPVVTDFLCGGCREHQDRLTALLAALDVEVVLNPRLVRGLDYYTRTIFEVTTDALGAQNAVAAGGRYDGLVKEFGGPETPAFGFAVGMERLVALAAATPDVAPADVPYAYITVLGWDAAPRAAKIASAMRASGKWVETGEPGASLKSQLKRADRFHARFALFIGDNEIKTGTAGWKDLIEGSSGSVALDDPAWIDSGFGA